MPSNRVSELLEEVRVTIVVARFSGNYCATVLEFGLWNSYHSFEEVVYEVSSAVTQLIEVYVKRFKDIGEFLEHNDFVREGKLYSHPEEARKKLVEDYISGLYYSKDDPNRNDPIRVITMKLRHVQVTERSARDASSVSSTHWETRRESTVVRDSPNVRNTIDATELG